MYGLRQASKMSLSHEARGFRPGAKRTSLVQLNFARADMLAFLVVLTMIAVSLTVRLSGHGAVIPGRL